MARNRDRSASFRVSQHASEWQLHVREIERRLQILIDAEQEHMAVLGLDFACLQDDQAEAVLEVAVVRVTVELSVFR